MAQGGDVDWRAGKTVAECNREMLERGLHSDVIFHVGPNRVGMNVHRYVLSSRSEIFANLLYDSEREDQEPISLENIDPDDFQQVLRFIYHDNLDVPNQSLCNVGLIANEYDLHQLLMHCIKVLKTMESYPNVLDHLNFAILTGASDLIDVCINRIYRNTNDVLKSSEFLGISLRCLVEIMRHHRLNMTPEDIFLQLKAWGRRQCHLVDQLVNGPNLRRILTCAIINCIKFRNMSSDFYQTQICGSLPGLLNPNMQEEIRLFLNNPRVLAPGIDFPRSLIFMRFRRSRTGKGYHRREWDSLSFKLDADVYLTHFMIYGSCDKKRAAYQIKFNLVQALHDTTNIVYRKTYNQPTDGCIQIYDIGIPPQLVIQRLTDRVRLSANTLYSIHALFRGPPSYYGDDGTHTITDDGVTIQFDTNYSGLNHTTVLAGQFPGLIFQKVN